MSAQLLIVKRLFLEATKFAESADPIAAGIATSLLQDAVELYLWTLIKERNIQVKDNDGFVVYLQKLQDGGVSIPSKARLLELNKARVNFKHYGNLPAPAEAAKHRDYVEDFLRESMKPDFGIDFDKLSLADLVTDSEIREHLQCADHLLKAGSTTDAAIELAKARTLAFQIMNRYMPAVDHRLGDADRALNAINGVQGVRPFTYLREYLGALREASLVAMLDVPVEDYGLLSGGLPNASRAVSGKWHISHRGTGYPEAQCRKAFASLVSLCLRLQSRP